MKQMAIASSLMKHWQEETTIEVPTSFPGMRLDTSALTGWLEWRTEFWKPYVQRSGQQELQRLSVEVHVYSRGVGAGPVLHRLVDEVLPVYTRTTMEVHDYEESGAPLIGYVSLYEPEVRELSREELNQHGSQLRHALVEWRGMAQELV
ncbi:hypothetical protein Pla110_06850 [Polystyrenella longa]|uniref:Uncharacterized protein n=1 Tax=Polystyrenella longa TaxID=2528007 RepID=A0A518CIC7_9PLAN|nr:hypothetical protein [Polystyrenella longa]QDU78981.1 hypothetical protein Pla110_06850 [Polystyrenella longa]